MDVDELTFPEWERNLPSSGYQAFHRPDVLKTLDKHSGSGQLRLYGGFKGQQCVALMPVFINEAPLGIRTISSPPPGMHVPHLGPILMPTSPKVRKCERVNRTFTEGLLDALGIGARSLVFFVCSPEYTDPRPFKWDGLSVDVSFTYNLHIGTRSSDELLADFSKSRRREIRDAESKDVSIVLGDLDEGQRIYEQTDQRFSEQDEYFGLTWPFARDVMEALGENCRIYVAEGPDGEFLSGIITLASNDTISFWLGGVRTDYEGLSMNSLLHWAIIRDIADDDALSSVTTYDMVGAGEYRLSRFKSKFSPSLEPYYVVHSGGGRMRMARAAYDLLNRVRSRV